MKKVKLILCSSGEIDIAYFDDIESEKVAMKEEYEETIQAFQQFKSFEHRIDENTAWINSEREYYSWKLEENTI